MTHRPHVITFDHLSWRLTKVPGYEHMSKEQVARWVYHTMLGETYTPHISSEDAFVPPREKLEPLEVFERAVRYLRQYTTADEVEEVAYALEIMAKGARAVKELNREPPPS